MTQLIFNITGQIIKRGDNLPVVSDSVGVVSASFNFDDAWDGYTKSAVFKQGTAVEIVELTNDECDIPAEVMTSNRDLIVSVYGESGTDRLTTNTSRVCMIKSGYEVIVEEVVVDGED
jgi:hypothetical protein